MKENPKSIQAQKESKVPMELLPWGPLAEVAKVLEGGAEKYGRRNWLVDEIRASTYVGAIGRHAFLEWAQGVNQDHDSGRHPLAHVAACCLLVMEAESKGMLIDDRLFAESKTPPAMRDTTHAPNCPCCSSEPRMVESPCPVDPAVAKLGED